MQDWLKEDSRGPWSITHFDISRNEAMLYAISCYGGYERPPTPGRYTRLCHEKRGVVMSDTYQELIDLWSLDVLLKKSPGMDLHISGLGLGIFAKYALDKQFRVEVVEIDPDVIALVEPQLRAAVEHPEYLTVIQGDALTWAPPKGKHYGAAWHDIWDEINLDNWPEYKLLRRRWAHWARVQGCWADWSLRRQLRQERYDRYY